MKAEQKLRRIIREHVKRALVESGKGTLIRTQAWRSPEEEAQLVDRMEGLANEKELRQLQSSVQFLGREWEKEGFEIDEILFYIERVLTGYLKM